MPRRPTSPRSSRRSSVSRPSPVVSHNSIQPVVQQQSFGKIMKDSFVSGIGFQAGAMMVRSLFPGTTQTQAEQTQAEQTQAEQTQAEQTQAEQTQGQAKQTQAKQTQGQSDQLSSCDDIKRVFNSCLEKAEKSACTEIAYAFNQKDYNKCIEQHSP